MYTIQDCLECPTLIRKTTMLMGDMDAKKVKLIMLFKYESGKKSLCPEFPSYALVFLVLLLIFVGHAVKYYSKSYKDCVGWTVVNLGCFMSIVSRIWNSRMMELPSVTVKNLDFKILSPLLVDFTVFVVHEQEVGYLKSQRFTRLCNRCHW